MGWKGNSDATFNGASGQMAVMGELLHRKCNAAIPPVDIGMDVFAFRDEREEVARIQVKTAIGSWYKKGNGFHAAFRVPIAQLERTDSPPLFYALVVRLDNNWISFIIISRSRLEALRNEGCGSKNKKSGQLELHVRFRQNASVNTSGAAQLETLPKLTAMCGDFDLTAHIDAWEILPPLKSLVDVLPPNLI